MHVSGSSAGAALAPTAAIKQAYHPGSSRSSSSTSNGPHRLVSIESAYMRKSWDTSYCCNGHIKEDEDAVAVGVAVAVAVAVPVAVAVTVALAVCAAFGRRRRRRRRCHRHRRRRWWWWWWWLWQG